MKEQRRLTNLMIRPSTQMRIAFQALVGVMTALALASTLIVYKLLAADSPFEDMISDANARIRFTLLLFGVFGMTMVVLGVTSVVVTFIFTHKIFGPLVPIGRHLEELINGNYRSRVQIRDRDDLQDLASQVNRLAESLEKRHGPGVPSGAPGENEKAN